MAETKLLPKPRSTKNYVEMRRQAKKNVQVWRGWVNGDETIFQWGAVDGKMQQTIDIPGARGKAGTKAWVSADQAAVDKLIREVTTKAKKGDKLMNELKGAIAKPLAIDLQAFEATEQISFDGPLPPNVCFSKPVNSIPDERVRKMCGQMGEGVYAGGPRVEFTVKINGMCHLITKDRQGDVWIQKRGKLEIENEKYPHLLEEFDAILPRGSMFLCEFFVGNGRSRKDFADMQSIANSLPDRAIKMQKKIGLVRAYVFRNPFWKFAEIEHTTLCSIWLDSIEALIDGYPDESRAGGVQPGFSDSEFVQGVIRVGSDYEEVMAELEEEQYEGYVMYRCDKPLGDKYVSFLGQPDRPAVCWKIKLEREDDFIAEWDPEGLGTHCSRKCSVKDQHKETKTGKCSDCGKKLQPSGAFGSGKNLKRVGSLSLFQLTAEGTKQYICEVSSGLSDKERTSIAKDGMLIDVANVAYQDRSYISKGEETNALFLPRIIGFRKDKELMECVNEEL
jgi:hypothetical protein